ncbi:hypothetical protein GCM10010988_38930 [Cnuibacter physcomitrellae]|nr:hypothetical protein GCM10010988_38930 [Cnuibacter physcomitrellae]
MRPVNAGAAAMPWRRVTPAIVFFFELMEVPFDSQLQRGKRAQVGARRHTATHTWREELREPDQLLNAEEAESVK